MFTFLGKIVKENDNMLSGKFKVLLIIYYIIYTMYYLYLLKEKNDFKI